MVEIIRSSAADAPRVIDFMVPICQAVYPNEKYGIRPEHFSREVLSSPRLFGIIADALENRDNQIALLAVEGERIVGSISLARMDDHYKFQTFYVTLDRQRSGIGTRLAAEALAFYDGSLPIRLDTAETNLPSIALYKKWGFVERLDLGVRVMHWEEWPQGVTNGYVFMDLSIEDARKLKLESEKLR